jgi:hypothetical protein
MAEVEVFARLLTLTCNDGFIIVGKLPREAPQLQVWPLVGTEAPSFITLHDEQKEEIPNLDSGYQNILPTCKNWSWW